MIVLCHSLFFFLVGPNPPEGAVVRTAVVVSENLEF